MSKLDSIRDINIEARRLRYTLTPKLRQFDLNFSEFEILYQINKDKRSNPSIIADDLYTERAAVSRCLRELNEKSLIDYENAEEDRRKVYVSISSKGKKIINQIEKILSN